MEDGPHLPLAQPYRTPAMGLWRVRVHAPVSVGDMVTLHVGRHGNRIAEPRRIQWKHKGSRREAPVCRIDRSDREEARAVPYADLRAPAINIGYIRRKQRYSHAPTPFQQGTHRLWAPVPDHMVRIARDRARGIPLEEQFSGTLLYGYWIEGPGGPKRIVSAPAHEVGVMPLELRPDDQRRKRTPVVWLDADERCCAEHRHLLPRRLHALDRDGRGCLTCRARLATQVHHIWERQDMNGWEHCLDDIQFLASQCDGCHNTVTTANRRFRARHGAPRPGLGVHVCPACFRYLPSDDPCPACTADPRHHAGRPILIAPYRPPIE